MSVILKDSGNNVIYTFPSGCDVVSDPFNKRLARKSRVHAHGGVIVSDQKIATRIVSLHGVFGKASSATMETELNNMRLYCGTASLRLYATQYSDYYFNVECLNFEAEYLGKMTVVEVDIDFLVIDPFRYYKTETTDQSFTVDESPEALTVANGGNARVSPVITFTAGVSANFSKLTIQNATDSDKYFDYEPAANLTEGDIVEVDCANTTVKLNTVDDISHFEGSFFELLSGNNSISVTLVGTPGTNTCAFVFRKRYL